MGASVVISGTWYNTRLAGGVDIDLQPAAVVDFRKPDDTTCRSKTSEIRNG